MLLILLLAVPTHAAAQRDRTVVGGQVGWARSGISTNAPAQDGVTDRQGAFVGLFLRTRVIKWVALQPEIDLTVKGGSVPLEESPGVVAALEFGYLEFPLLVRFAPSVSGRGRGFRPVVFGGASAGVRLGCSITVANVADSLALLPCTESLSAVDWS